MELGQVSIVSGIPEVIEDIEINAVPEPVALLLYMLWKKPPECAPEESLRRIVSRVAEEIGAEANYAVNLSAGRFSVTRRLRVQSGGSEHWLRVNGQTVSLRRMEKLLTHCADGNATFQIRTRSQEGAEPDGNFYPEESTTIYNNFTKTKPTNGDNTMTNENNKLMNAVAVLDDDTVTVCGYYNKGERTYTYKCPRALAETLTAENDKYKINGSRLMVEGNSNLITVTEIHNEAKIDLDAEFSYKWVIAAVDFSGYYKARDREAANVEHLKDQRRQKLKSDWMKAQGLEDVTLIEGAKAAE
jgi:hypothetical protein